MEDHVSWKLCSSLQRDELQQLPLKTAPPTKLFHLARVDATTGNLGVMT